MNTLILRSLMYADGSNHRLSLLNTCTCEVAGSSHCASTRQGDCPLTFMEVFSSTLSKVASTGTPLVLRNDSRRRLRIGTTIMATAIVVNTTPRPPAISVPNHNDMKLLMRAFSGESA